MHYSNERLEAILKLTPKERWILFYHNPLENDQHNFNEDDRDDIVLSEDELLKTIVNNGFFNNGFFKTTPSITLRVD